MPWPGTQMPMPGAYSGIGNGASGFASHIHVQVVIIQRIINQVAKTSDTP
jgi:hypothetical protein